MFDHLKEPGVVHSGDNLTGAGDGDDELITIRLTELPSDVCQLFFTVNM
jgi:tellurium resistance protein TerZ